MKNRLFYIFTGLILINVLINGLMSFFNLVLAGILLAVLAGKEKTGRFST